MESRQPKMHGLAARQIVIPGESEQEYTALRADLFDSYQPATAAEEILTDQITEGYWRVMRARKVEVDFWKKTIETPGKAQPDPDGYPTRRPPSDYDEALGRAFRKHADEHTRMHRYVTSIERVYYKAIRELQKEQTIRQERRESVSQKPEEIAKAVNQSVSQNPEQPTATHPAPVRPESVSQEPKEAPLTPPAPELLASRSSLLYPRESVSQKRREAPSDASRS